MSHVSLDRVAEWLRADPSIDPVKIEVGLAATGGDASTRKRRAGVRAEVIRDYLIAKGLAAGRLEINTDAAATRSHDWMKIHCPCRLGLDLDRVGATEGGHGGHAPLREHAGDACGVRGDQMLVAVDELGRQPRSARDRQRRKLRALVPAEAPRGAADDTTGRT